jgi:hypothetical protein
MSAVALREIRVRYPNDCIVCGKHLTAGTTALWDKDASTLRCVICELVAPVLPLDLPAREDRLADGTEPLIALGTAGTSAQRMADRQHEKFLAENQAIRERHRIVGGLIAAWREEPQSNRAWARGAAGERGVGRWLDKISRPDVIVLHDHRIPKSRSNIDHIVVGPRGVFVIDAKSYKGRVAKRDKGGRLRADIRLYVGSRDCSRLIKGMAKQVAAVEDVAGDLVAEARAPITPMLCFLDAEWGIFSNGLLIDGVPVVWPRRAIKMVAERGHLTPEQVEGLARRLAARLPEA